MIASTLPLLFGLVVPTTPSAPVGSLGGTRVLVFSKTAGFRHDSIPDGIAAIKQIGTNRGWTVDATEDSSAFSPENLRRYDVAVFLCTTGDVLDDAQQAAFEAFIGSGKGFVGVHSATDTEYGWPWYGKLIGAYFKRHPQIQKATILVENRSHPTTRFLPKHWVRTDEWYDFKMNPRAHVHVLASLQTESYKGSEMTDHPVIWWNTIYGGRAWYTELGHTKASYAEPLFRRHVAEGIAWAARG